MPRFKNGTYTILYFSEKAKRDYRRRNQTKSQVLDFIRMARVSENISSQFVEILRVDDGHCFNCNNFDSWN